MAALQLLTAAAQQQSLGVPVSLPQSPTSPSKKMFASITESLKALNANSPVPESSGEDSNRVSGIEPSADMMVSDHSSNKPSVLTNQKIEPTVDQHLQSAEEGFFETIDQVKSKHQILFFLNEMIN